MKDTILLVDDDSYVLQITKRLLLSIGFKQILTARCPTEALSLWRNQKDEIGFLLTDINMPGMSGDELATELLISEPDLNVFFMSGNPPELLNSKIPLHRGVNFIQKPFSPQQLGKVLGRPIPSTTGHKDLGFYAIAKVNL
jgi:FixJ family two-component response regulator